MDNVYCSFYWSRNSLFASNIIPDVLLYSDSMTNQYSIQYSPISHKASVIGKWTKSHWWSFLISSHPATHLTIRHTMSGKSCTNTPCFWDTPTSMMLSWISLKLPRMLSMGWHVNISHSCLFFAATMYSLHITVYRSSMYSNLKEYQEIYQGPLDKSQISLSWYIKSVYLLLQCQDMQWKLTASKMLTSNSNIFNVSQNRYCLLVTRSEKDMLCYVCTAM